MIMSFQFAERQRPSIVLLERGTLQKSAAHLDEVWVMKKCVGWSRRNEHCRFASC